MSKQREHLLPSGIGGGIWRAVVMGICCIIVVYEAYHQIRSLGTNTSYSDFQSYYDAATAVRRGVNPFGPAAAFIHSYSSANANNILQGVKFYVYPPAFALLLIPFTFLGIQQAFLVWVILSVILLAAAAYFTLGLAMKNPSVMSVLLLTAAASLTRVVRIEYFLGQADIFSLALIVAAFWTRLRGWQLPAGILLGLACLMKPVLLPLVAYLLWKREIGVAVAAAVSFLVLLLSPFLWLGSQTFQDQVLIWRFWSSEYLAFPGNYAPRGVLIRFMTPNAVMAPAVDAPLVAMAIWLALIAVVVILTAAVVSPEPLRRDAMTLLELGLVISAILLISPLTEYIHLMLLMIPLVGLLVTVRGDASPTPYGVIVTIACLGQWVVLCDVLHGFTGTSSPGSQLDLPTALGVPYLYILLVTYGLCIYGLLHGRKTSLWSALIYLVISTPVRLRAWFEGSKEMLPVTAERRLDN